MSRTLVALSLMLTMLLSACGPGNIPPIRGRSEGMIFSITADSLPPKAMDRVTWYITVTDEKTGQPIEGGQGQVFATNNARHSAGDGLEPAPQLGTYRGTFAFINADSWKMAVEFRRDSLSPFGRIDWTQEVRPPRPIGG